MFSSSAGESYGSVASENQEMLEKKDTAAHSTTTVADTRTSAIAVGTGAIFVFVAIFVSRYTQSPSIFWQHQSWPLLTLSISLASFSSALSLSVWLSACVCLSQSVSVWLSHQVVRLSVCVLVSVCRSVHCQSVSVSVYLFLFDSDIKLSVSRSLCLILLIQITLCSWRDVKT